MTLPTATEQITVGPIRLRADESAVLLEIAQAAGSTLDLSEVLERVVERSATLTGADRCSLWLLDPSIDQLRLAAFYGIDPTFATHWKRRVLAVNEERLSQEAIATGHPVVVVDASTDPRTDKKAVDFFGDKSILIVPLAHKGRVLGTLFLNHVRSYYQYTSQDIAVIQAIASQSAVAIVNAQLYEESRAQRLELLASFRRIGEALAAGLNLTDTLRLVVELATEMLQATVGALTLSTLDGITNEVQWAPANAPQRYGPTLRTLSDLAAEVIQRREPLYVADLSQFPQEEGLISLAEPLRTYVGVPLQVGVEIIGTLGVYHNLPRRFTPAEVDLLASFGSQAAIAIDKARLFGRLQLKVDELQAAAQRNAELYQKLELEKQRLDVIFRNSTDAIFMVRGDGQVVAFNPAAELLTGWTAAEAIGRPCAEIFPAASTSPVSLSSAIEQVLAAGDSRPILIEASILTGLANERHVGASYAYVPANNGEGPFALAVVRDITQQKEADRLKSDFVSMVSHELRTPLAVIKGYAATLLNTNLDIDAKRQTRFIRGINDASDRLTRLIDNLLSVSRLESGRFKLNPQTIDLAEVVRKVVGSLRTSAGSHALRFIVPPDGVSLHADRDQVEQVLVNLVTNALKYSLEGSEIVVELSTIDGPLSLSDLAQPTAEHLSWALLAVKDHGAGIAPNQLRLIFDKFYRGDSPTVRRVAGTGLGLYICRSIVEAHQGHIWADSQPGVGSTFYVALPRE